MFIDTDKSFYVLIFFFNLTGVPEIQKFSFQDNVLEGKVVSVMCLAVSEDKPIHFQWDKHGKILENTKNITIENSEKFSALIINNVSVENDGNYTCTAKNRYGSTKHSAYLNVKGKKLLF